MVAFNGRPCISFVISSLASRLRSRSTRYKIGGSGGILTTAGQVLPYPHSIRFREDIG